MLSRFLRWAVVIALILSTLSISGNAEQAPTGLFDAANGFRLAELKPRYVTLAVTDGKLGVSSQEQTLERGLVLPLGPDGMDLSHSRFVEAEITNRGERPLLFTFWAMTGLGWGGVSSFSTAPHPERETLGPGETRTIGIDLHARYSGAQVLTPAINPAKVRWLELVFEEARSSISLEISRVSLRGAGPADLPDVSKRLEVPDAVSADPTPGKRVFRSLPAWKDTAVKHVLTLPSDWQPGKKYPVLVEYTGNQFYHKYCYSTGYTADGHMAYGLAAGGSFIVLNLPFVSEDGQREQIDGWGSVEKAIDYCFAALRDAQANFGADLRAVVYVGFSRGAYAANYLALHNDDIAGVWAGFLTLRSPGMKWRAQNAGWRKVGNGWDERAARMKDRPWFHADPELGDEVHADVEFLEDRPSTLATRRWLQELVQARLREVTAVTSSTPANPSK
jgi:acetyl esterase/lipase